VDDNRRVQVSTDAAEDEQALVDLAVAEPFRGKLRNLDLLRREASRAPGVRRPMISPVARTSCRARLLN
jgi:hypothetical protein